MNAWRTRRNRTRRASSSWNEDGPGDHDHDSCPDAALLGAFCEGQLSESDREFVSSHLLHCSRCYFAFTESARLSEEGAQGSRAQSRDLWRQLAWAAALIVTTAVLASALLLRGEPQQQARVSASQEPSFVAGPPTPDGKPNEAAPVPKEQSPLAAVASWVVQHSHAGIVHVATAPTQRSGVRTPTPQDEAKSQALNALTESLLRRWQVTKSSDDAVAAFEQSQRAVAANPRSLDAKMNMALALESLSESFRREARKAWEEYLTFDSTSIRAKNIKRALEADADDQTSNNNSLNAATRHLSPPFHR
jgi:Putative zinc-finger